MSGAQALLFASGCRVRKLKWNFCGGCFLYKDIHRVVLYYDVVLYILCYTYIDTGQAEKMPDHGGN